MGFRNGVSNAEVTMIRGIDELGLDEGSEIAVNLVMELVTSDHDFKRKVVALERDSVICVQFCESISRLPE
jgi:hypothetical protein